MELECEKSPTLTVVHEPQLRHGEYNGRRHFVFNERGEQVGKRRLKDMPGQPRKRWEAKAAFNKRSRKAVV